MLGDLMNNVPSVRTMSCQTIAILECPAKILDFFRETFMSAMSLVVKKAYS